MNQALIDIAKRIPTDYRREILKMNMVSSAQAVASNPSMYYLFTIWKNYVEPGVDLDAECGTCLTRILDNYKGLISAFIEIEKQAQLLDAI